MNTSLMILGSLFGSWVFWTYLLFVFPLLCVTSFVCYGLDKWFARNAKRRIPEPTLHMIDAFGGWPGGWLGQRTFRHKTQKTSFLVFFWATAGFHMLCSYVVYRVLFG